MLGSRAVDVVLVLILIFSVNTAWTYGLLIG